MIKLAGPQAHEDGRADPPCRPALGPALRHPAGARLTGDTFVIPLTFGNQSDWSRNVRAAGGCEIRLDGAEYRADRPQLVDGPEARAVVRQAFGPAEHAMFRVLGIRQYLLLRRAAS
jgi:hypothetical protein